MPASKNTKPEKPAKNTTSTKPSKKPKPSAKPTAPATPPPTQNKNPLVDAGLKLRWEEAISRYHTAKAEETASWDDRYEALGEILDSDPPYYLAGGFKSARAFLTAEVPDQDERTVRTFVRVARWFDPEDEAKYGITKLDLLLRYLEASGGAPLAPAKIHVAKTKVTVTRGKARVSVLFPDVTADELRVATRDASSKSGQVTAKAPPLVKAIRAALSKAKLGAVGVRLRAGKVDLTGIPQDGLGTVATALGTVKLPKDG